MYNNYLKALFCTKKSINSIYQFQIRPCEIYKSEYDECTAIASRFHQMFIHGSTVDCNLWHVDYQNCLRWKNDKDIKSAVNHFNDKEIF